ncbi:MAG TPA: bacillithiol system redox-active protein YtxJ [Rhodothermales bacterium]|nr:bacillithiol system redox-active protein YtxJ [Rhodothermales bacterium]
MAEATELTTATDAEAMLAASFQRPVALLKHSATCYVSSRGRAEFLGLSEDGDPPLYVVVVQRARGVSNSLADTLGIRHESPQAIILKDGAAVLVQNHGRIRADDLRRAAHEATQAAA